MLIARAASHPLDEFLDERLFGPLGMTDTDFFVPAAKLDRFGALFTADSATSERTVYDPRDDQWSRKPAFLGGGAGLVSTVGDFHRFADMLRSGGSSQGGRVLSEASVRTMTTNQLTDVQQRPGTELFIGILLTNQTWTSRTATRVRHVLVRVAWAG